MSPLFVCGGLCRGEWGLFDDSVCLLQLVLQHHENQGKIMGKRGNTEDPFAYKNVI